MIETTNTNHPPHCADEAHCPRCTTRAFLNLPFYLQTRIGRTLGFDAMVTANNLLELFAHVKATGSIPEFKRLVWETVAKTKGTQ